MTRRARWIVRSLIVALACPAARAGENPSRQALHRLFDDYWQFRMRRDPERATYLGDHRFGHLLRDYSDEARLAQLAAFRGFRQRLAAIDRAALPPEDRVSADLFNWTIDEALALAAYPDHLMPIDQQESPHITLGLLQLSQPFRHAGDWEAYAGRLRGFGRQADQLIAAMNEGLRRGIVRPKITIEQVLPQIEEMIREDPRESILFAPATTRAPGADTERMLEAATAEAIAALRRLADYLRDEYLPHAREAVGLCHLPDGRAWYRRLARHHTTTDLSPETLHRTGLDELKRIHADMRRIAAEVGFDGDLPAFIERIRTDPAQHNQSAEEIMRRHAAILRRSDALLPRVFGVLPRIPYQLKEMEPFRAPQAPEAYYYNAPDDGSRTAYFYVNTCEPQTRPIFTMEALAYHEAQPGHHLQLAIAQEKKDRPMFRRFESINAFIEGWALYSEVLGYQLGGYRDPYSRFGQLTYDTWRSSRLVVDTGMHYFGWTREQAIRFMKENTALSGQNIISEVDRYIAWPGQALSYKVGQLEILRLRREAEQRLKERFDLRSFHDHLLAEGSLPMSMLRRRMTEWIESRAAAGPAAAATSGSGATTSPGG
jgi:prolyl oligopeptidase